MNKKLISFSISISILLFLSCNNSNSEIGFDDSCSITDFQEEELLKLINTFDKLVCKNVNLAEHEVIQCYEIYLNGLYSNLQNHHLELKINHDDQEMLMNTLSQDLREDIWISNNDPNNSKPNIYFLNVQGGLFECLLKSIENNESKIAKIIKDTELIGELPITHYDDMLNNYLDYNITKPKNRLFYIITLMTINSEFLSREK